MTPRQADKLIKDGKPVTVRNTFYDETFTAVFVRRDRWNVYTEDGCYDRGELELVSEETTR
jgi:hypothetical protein